MLIGGFYHVDGALMDKVPSTDTFALRCDTQGDYQRKIFTNNGRTATVYSLINGLSLTQSDVILLPDYLCVSVLNALEVSKAQFRFYKIKEDLSIDVDDLQEKMNGDVKVIYVIHYFGAPQPAHAVDAVLALKAQYQAHIIEDLTQTLYTTWPGRIGFGDFLVASTRKWIPATDGGICAVKTGIPCADGPLADAYDQAVYRQLQISVARDHLDANPEAKIQDYLNLEKAANAARYLDFTPRAMTELSSRVLFGMDHEASIKKRRENYQYLYEHLHAIPELKPLGQPLDDQGRIVPFGFPVLVDRRDELYHDLAQHGIIGEIQWILPTEYYTPGTAAQFLSDHNVMLQCDQRYGWKEMEFVVQTIKMHFQRRTCYE